MVAYKLAGIFTAFFGVVLTDSPRPRKYWNKKANVVGLQVADLVAYPITRHILDPNEPNLAYDTIKNNIYSENTKQIGIKLIPHQEKKDCQN